MSSGMIYDDRNLIEVLKLRVESAGYEVTTALKVEEAIEATKSRMFDLAILDLQLEQGDGISLMLKLHQLYPDLPVIILTAHGTIESAVEAMKQGAYSYVTKPFNARNLLLQIEKALENRGLKTEIRRLKNFLEEEYEFGNIVARSEKMQSVLETVSRIAGTDSTVYIQGESGTGKELIAKAIHLASPRKDHTRGPSREQALRSREGGFYRGNAKREGVFHPGSYRHHLPGRDRRYVPHHPGQGPQGSSGTPILRSGK
jgi:two-component system response regulator GlrR